MDGRTDGIALAYTRYSIYAVACKNANDGSTVVRRTTFRGWALWWEPAPAVLQIARRCLPLQDGPAYNKCVNFLVNSFLYFQLNFLFN